MGPHRWHGARRQAHRSPSRTLGKGTLRPHSGSTRFSAPRCADPWRVATTGRHGCHVTWHIATALSPRPAGGQPTAAHPLLFIVNRHCAAVLLRWCSTRRPDPQTGRVHRPGPAHRGPKSPSTGRDGCAEKSAEGRAAVVPGPPGCAGLVCVPGGERVRSPVTSFGVWSAAVPEGGGAYGGGEASAGG